MMDTSPSLPRKPMPPSPESCTRRFKEAAVFGRNQNGSRKGRKGAEVQRIQTSEKDTKFVSISVHYFDLLISRARIRAIDIGQESSASDIAIRRPDAIRGFRLFNVTRASRPCR